MVVHLDFILVASLVCLAVHAAFTFDGMILTKVGLFLDERLPMWMRKPLYACLSCMGVTYGLGLTLGLSCITKVQERASEDVIFMVAVHLLAIVGINTLFAILLRVADDIADAADALTDVADSELDGDL